MELVIEDIIIVLYCMLPLVVADYYSVNLEKEIISLKSSLTSKTTSSIVSCAYLCSSQSICSAAEFEKSTGNCKLYSVATFDDSFQTGKHFGLSALQLEKHPGKGKLIY